MATPKITDHRYINPGGTFGHEVDGERFDWTTGVREGRCYYRETAADAPCFRREDEHAPPALPLQQRVLDKLVDGAVYVAATAVALFLSAWDRWDRYHGRPQWPDDKGRQ